MSLLPVRPIRLHLISSHPHLHSFAFSEKLPSAYVINTPPVGLNWRVDYQCQRPLTSSQKDYLLSISAVVFLLLKYFSYMEPPPIYVFPLIEQEHASWYI